MRRKAGHFVFTLLMLFSLLCACENKTSKYDTQKTEQTQGHPAFMDNTTASSSGTYFYAGNEASLYYCSNRVLYYYSFNNRQTLPICTQSGCAHDSELCKAWLGENVTYVAFYDGKIYYVDGVSFIKMIPGTGKREKITDLDKQVSDSAVNFVSTMYISHSNAYINVMSIPENMENGIPSSTLLQIELNTGETKLLFQSSLNFNYQFIGASGNNVFMSVSYLPDDTYSETEYVAAGNDAAGYGPYLQNQWEENGNSELRLYNLQDNDYMSYSGSLSIDSSKCYGDYAVFEDRGTFYRIDIGLGEITELFKSSNVINFFLFDEKVFYITKNDNGIGLQYRPLMGGEEVVMENEGNLDVCVFSISQETENHFLGIYDGKYAWIDKSDFYAEKYDQVVFF